jgi:hypothetical protein
LGATILLGLFFMVDGSRAEPVALPGQSITLPASASEPLFVDMDGRGRCDLFVIDQAAKTLWRFHQRANGFTNAPDQVIPLPPQTAWVAVCDVDASPGLELLMSTATGLVYSRQKDGQFEAERHSLMEASQVFTNGDFPILTSLATNPAGTGVLIPVIAAGQTVLYHRNRAYEWSPEPARPLDAQPADWSVVPAPWRMGSSPAHSLHVTQSFLAKPDRDQGTEPENEAIRKFLADLKDNPASWPPHTCRMDVNGDGREDLVVWQLTGKMDIKTDIYVFLRGADEKLPERPTQILHCHGLPIPIGSTGVFRARRFFPPPVQDLQGDGHSELVLLEFKTQITSWSGIIETALTHGLDWALTIRSFAQGGFSGSPDASVLVTAILPAEILTEWPIFIYGDFNGDGRPDLVVRRSDTQWNIFFSTDDGHWFAPQPALTFDTPGHGNLEIKDLNGKGRADVIWHDLDQPRLVIFWSPTPPAKDKNP